MLLRLLHLDIGTLTSPNLQPCLLPSKTQPKHFFLCWCFLLLITPLLSLHRIPDALNFKNVALKVMYLRIETHVSLLLWASLFHQVLNRMLFTYREIFHRRTNDFRSSVFLWSKLYERICSKRFLFLFKLSISNIYQLISFVNFQSKERAYVENCWSKKHLFLSFRSEFWFSRASKSNFLLFYFDVYVHFFSINWSLFSSIKVSSKNL